MARRLNNSKCTQCGVCFTECPAMRFHGYSASVKLRAQDCIDCGHCDAICPHQAAQLSLFEQVHVGDTYAREALALLRSRYSVRAYTSEPVPFEKWRILLQAMREAPSGMNARPVHATVVSDPERLRMLSESSLSCVKLAVRMMQNPIGRMLLRIAVGKNEVSRLLRIMPELVAISTQVSHDDPILHRAPGVMVIHADRCSPTGHEDCLLAAMNAMVIAPTIGLGTCVIGFALPAFERMPALRKHFAIPPAHHVCAVLAVGHPASALRREIIRPDLPVHWIPAKDRPSE